MNRPSVRLLFLCAVALAATGCMPRTTVHKDPGPRDRGVRFYRPKPYLMIQPQVTTAGVPSDSFVQISMQTLPDYNEEYSIHVRSGLGVNDTEITLKDGWNLTNLNVNIDSKFAENLEAVSGLVGSVAKAAGGPSAVPRAPGAPMVVRASNVPMGLYEAVIGNSGERKFLLGFRYVGFLPFTPCPIDAGGVPDTFCCVPQQHEIYGLVFDNGVMTFKQIADIRDLQEPDGLNAVVPQYNLPSPNGS